MKSKKDKQPHFNFSQFLKKIKLTKKEFFYLFFLVVLGLFLRFVNYPNRWGLAYDQARDVIVVTEALARHQIPLIGPFAASGPFVFGPYWYWINMVIVFLTPSWVIIPWVFQGIRSAFVCVIAFYIGRKVLDGKLGLFFAYLTVISTARIVQSTNLTYSTAVGFICFLMLFFAVSYIKSKKLINLFLAAMLSALAISVHFQAIGTIFMLPLLFFAGNKSFKALFVMTVGFLIPFFPVIMFDFLSNHFQSRNVLDFLLHGNGIPALPKRWLTYLDFTWPTIWGRVIGGNIFVAYLTIIGVISAFFYSTYKGKLSKSVIILVIYLLLNILFLRYYKGQLFDAFYVYLYSVILLLTAWFVAIILRYNKKIGYMVFALITVFTLISDYKEIKSSTNFTASNIDGYMIILKNTYPGQKFDVYDYGYLHGHSSLPLVMYLQNGNLTSDSGHRIGFIDELEKSKANLKYYPVISGEDVGIQLVDLNSSTSSQLRLSNWAPVNPSYIYDSVENWYKK